MEKCCKHIHPKDEFNWGANEVLIPVSTKTDGIVKNKPLSLEVSRAIIPILLQKRSQAGYGAVLSTHLGMRLGEDVCIQVKNIHFTNGEFGYGYANIVEGKAGGAKNGTPRIIPIIDQEAQDALKFIVAGKKSDDYVLAKKCGNKMTKGNVLKIIGEIMDTKCKDTYKGNRCHAMRKTWAQRYFDLVRPGCSREEAVAKTNEVLGHAIGSGEQGLKDYVKNIY